MSAIEILRQLALGTSRLGRYSRIEPQAADRSFFNSDLSGAAIARYPLKVLLPGRSCRHRFDRRWSLLALAFCELSDLSDEAGLALPLGKATVSYATAL